MAASYKRRCEEAEDMVVKLIGRELELHARIAELEKQLPEPVTDRCPCKEDTWLWVSQRRTSEIAERIDELEANQLKPGEVRSIPVCLACGAEPWANDQVALDEGRGEYCAVCHRSKEDECDLVEVKGGRPPAERELTCVFCGHAYPAGTAPAGDQVLIDHINVCEKHPLKAVREERDRYKRALESIAGYSEPRALRELITFFEGSTDPADGDTLAAARALLGEE